MYPYHIYHCSWCNLKSEELIVYSWEFLMSHDGVVEWTSTIIIGVQTSMVLFNR